MKTFKTVHYRDMISNNDVVKLLEEVGFTKLNKNDRESGYFLRYVGAPGRITRDDIEVYLKRGYLNIHITPTYLNLDIYKLDSQNQGELSQFRSWHNVKKMKYKKEAGMEEFKNFLLLSICRDSFLDPEEEDRIRSRDMIDGFYIKEDEGWKEWYL